MSDIHSLPLVERDPPINKLKIRKGCFSVSWAWSHACPNGYEYMGDYRTYELALFWGKAHMRRHHGVEI